MESWAEEGPAPSEKKHTDGDPHFPSELQEFLVTLRLEGATIRHRMALAHQSWYTQVRPDLPEKVGCFQVRGGTGEERGVRAAPGSSPFLYPLLDWPELNSRVLESQQGSGALGSRLTAVSPSAS